jgi:hypothetical protein
VFLVKKTKIMETHRGKLSKVFCKTMHLLAVQKFNEIDFKIADHPAFSPHLTPFSHYLFSNLKKNFER